jgi:hypothetical protein
MLTLLMRAMKTVVGVINIRIVRNCNDMYFRQLSLYIGIHDDLEYMLLKVIYNNILCEEGVLVTKRVNVHQHVYGKMTRYINNY